MRDIPIIKRPTMPHGVGSLTYIPTDALVAELRKRGGVETHQIGPAAEIKLSAQGPAIILVVQD